MKTDTLILIGAIVVALLALLHFAYRGVECEARGGTLIKSGMGYVCVKLQRIPE